MTTGLTMYYPNNGNVLVVERQNYRVLQRLNQVRTVAAYIQEVGLDAWSRAEWVKEIAAELNDTPDSLARMTFPPTDVSFNNELIRSVQASDSTNRGESTYWLGRVLQQHPEEQDGHRLDATLLADKHPGPPHGFIKTTVELNAMPLDTNHLDRPQFKRSSVKIQELNVVNDQQGQKLALVLAHSALTYLSKSLPATIAAAANNRRIRHFAENYGFNLTQDYREVDLFDGRGIEFTRYFADSVDLVLRTMTELNPWLDEPEVAPLSGH